MSEGAIPVAIKDRFGNSRVDAEAGLQGFTTSVFPLATMAACG